MMTTLCAKQMKFLKDKICSVCGSSKSGKWYSGPTCTTCHSRAYRINNPDYHKIYQQERALNPLIKEKERLRSAERYWSNKSKVIEERRIYQSERLKVDILFKLQRNMRARLNKALQGNYKTSSAVKDLGCSIEELKQHLESKFQSGMTWENYGKNGWHIDHIKPLASATSEEEMLKLCHYMNLQPLWAQENLSKGKKYE